MYNAYFLLINMTLFLNIYIFIYTISLCSIYYLINLNSSLDSNNSITQLLYSLITFSKFKAPILTLFLSLSGLPPFFLFFIKFNYLTYVFFSFNPFVSFLIFILFFLNMVYYIQIFFFKNELYNNFSIKSIKKQFNLSTVFYIYFFIFFLLFSIFFVTDLIYILKLL